MDVVDHLTIAIVAQPGRLPASGPGGMVAVAVPSGDRGHPTAAKDPRSVAAVTHRSRLALIRAWP